MLKIRYLLPQKAASAASGLLYLFTLKFNHQMHDVKKSFKNGEGRCPTRMMKGGENLSRPSQLPSRKCGPKRAFSIVEVMMAVAVMALAITTSITTMQRGFLSLDTARKMTIAGQILQCEMEKMRMVPWATINAYPATLDPMTLDTIFLSNPAISSAFTLRRDVTVIEAASATVRGRVQITYTVSWKSYDGRTLSRNYTTYYGEKGLYDYYYNSI